MKRLLYIIPCILLVLILGGLFAVSQIDTDILRTRISDMVQEATGKPLRMATAPKVSFFPLGVTFGEARWGMSGAHPAKEGFSAAVKSGSVHLKFLPLLSGRVVIDEVRLDNPVVTLRPVRQGSPPLAAPKTAPADSGATPEETPSALPPIELARLSIVNGTLALETENGTAVRADGFNVSITNLKPGAEAVVKLDMTLESHNPDLEGNLSLATKARLKGALLELRQASLTATPLRGPLPQAAGPVQILLDGAYDLATGQMDLSSLKLTCNGLKAVFSGSARPSAASLQGALRIDAAPRALAKLFGSALPASGGKDALTLSTRLLLEDDRLRLSALKGSVDDTSLQGDLTLGLGNVPSIRGVLEIGDILLDAWLEAEAAAAPGGESHGAASGTAASVTSGRRGANGTAPSADTSRHSASPNNLSPTPTYPSVNVDLKVASLTFSAVRLTHIQAHLFGESGRYAAEPLTLRLNTGGSAAAALGADLNTRRYTLSGKAADVAVGPLLQALRGARPLDAAAFLEARLSCAGATMPEIKESVSGKGHLSLRNIVLNGISVLPQGVPDLSGKNRNVPTHFEALQAPFTATSGIVTIFPLTLASPALTAKGKAMISLPQDSLDFAADIHLLGMTVPVVASGPFSHLSYGVDPRRTLETLIRTPGGLLRPDNSGKGASPRNPVQDLGGAVRGLFGR